MSSKVKAIPEGYHNLTPYLIVNGAADAIELYKKLFNAEEIMRMEMSGKIGHAELKIGDSKIMLADEYESMGFRSPKAYGGSPVGMHLYVEDVDPVFNSAIALGAKVIKPLENMFYGDRSGTFEDPYGHTWTVSTHIEDVSDEEIEKRVAQMKSK